MPQMKSIQFPGSTVVYEVADETARTKCDTLEQDMEDLQGEVGQMVSVTDHTLVIQATGA